MALPLERLVTEQMASGDLSLLLTERISWRSFPSYAETLLEIVGGTVVDRVESPVERVWTVRICGQLFWLAYDDYPLGVSLDSQNSDASSKILEIQQTLLNHRVNDK